MNIIYSNNAGPSGPTKAIFWMRFALIAQTAFATNANESKGNATGNLTDPPNNTFNVVTGDPKHGSINILIYK